ncbi:glycosyltransferase family 2 protein [Chloroflexota bacterium]
MRNLPISVIIIAKNAEETIEDCLSSIQRNNPAEIIVVDGNSADRTVEIARCYTDRIYSDDGNGPSFARQLGAEQAKQEYVAYVDSDIILTEGTLTTMLTELQRSDYVSLNAQVSPKMKTSNYWDWAQWQQNQYIQLRLREGHLGTMACLLPKEVILRYKFDSSAGVLDDIDLEFRLKKAGYKLGTSSALIYRRYLDNLKSLIKRRFSFGRYYKPRAICKYGPWHAGFWPPLITAYWLAFCLIKGKPALVPYIIVDGVAEMVGMVVGFTELIGKVLKRRR